jgi:release factor glutamine methyltransferase
MSGAETSWPPSIGEREGRVSDALDAAAAALDRAGVPSPRVDAELLLAHVLGEPRARIQVLAILGTTVADGDMARFAALVDRRAAREPLQHLTGLAAFRTMELKVGPGVFVPRPETEIVVQFAIDALRASASPQPRAVDLGTGSGAIALSMAAEVPHASVIGVEFQPRAFVWARENLAALALPNARIVCDDLARALPDLNGTVDVVISNPPYIPEGMVPRDPEVRLHDPVSALFGGPDGLDPMRDVVATAARLLRPGGTLVVEHAGQQGEQVRALFAVSVWHPAVTHPDLTGRDRATVATRR